MAFEPDIPPIQVHLREAGGRAAIGYIARAVDGVEQTMPVADQVRGTRYGRIIRDPFGHVRAFNAAVDR